MSAGDFKKGSIVEVSAGRGKVRFCGPTKFAPGKWVGIELTEPKGKNDGTIDGFEYFKCKQPYGVFVRPSQVKLLNLGEEEEDGGLQPVVVSPIYFGKCHHTTDKR